MTSTGIPIHVGYVGIIQCIQDVTVKRTGIFFMGNEEKGPWDERRAYGDYVVLGAIEDVHDAATLLADQLRETLMIVEKEGKITFPISLGWLAREFPSVHPLCDTGCSDHRKGVRL